MSDNDDRRNEIIPPSLPVVYVPAAKYTDKTPVLTPLLLPALRAMAVMGMEWTTLNFIENVPIIVRIATFVISAFVLAVLECRDWLNFKRRHLFAYLISGLVVIYLTICGYAFIYLQEPPAPNPAVTELETNLAAAMRARDIAISERDAARREHGQVSPSPSIPPLPPSMRSDEIEARIDAWKAVGAQLNDVDRLLSEGDNVVNNWQSSNRNTLRETSMTFTNDAGTTQST
jgi:hypothetical protein